MARQVPVKAYRYGLGAVVPAVLVGGYFNPYVGLVVPAVMAASLGFAALGRGRRFCGHYCPRGSFLDGWLRWLPRRRPLPEWTRGGFRWAVLAVLMGFLGWRLAQDPASVAHWGRVFWFMCAVTTAAALALAALYRSRAWCAVCPIGTLAGSLQRPQPLFTPPEGCRQCGACDRACPLDLSPSRGLAGRAAGDCLQCGACAAVCPVAHAEKSAAAGGRRSPRSPSPALAAVQGAGKRSRKDPASEGTALPPAAPKDPGAPSGPGSSEAPHATAAA